jgi:hypothetical protein
MKRERFLGHRVLRNFDRAIGGAISLHVGGSGRFLLQSGSKDCSDVFWVKGTRPAADCTVRLKSGFGQRSRVARKSDAFARRGNGAYRLRRRASSMAIYSAQQDLRPKFDRGVARRKQCLRRRRWLDLRDLALRSQNNNKT